jgi:uncharacterized protein (TIGR02266 family)
VPEQTRRDMRTPITLKIKFKSSNLEQFIERYSVDVSRGGIFIRTKEPLPVGTQLRFEFQLQDAQSLIAGDGTVVWIREHDPARQGVAPGMGVRFDKLAVESQKVLDKILMEKNKRGDAQLESRFDAGVRASAAQSGTLSPQAPRSGHNDFSGGDSKINTPLPGAVPGLEAPGDEFGNESTRVMQNELVQSLADRTRGLPDEHAANAFSEPELTRKASIEELKLHVAEARPKEEAKVQIAPEANLPEPKPEPKREEAKPELKLEAKRDEPKIEAKPVEKKEEPKPEAAVEAKQPKKDEAKPVEKKEEPRLIARDRPGREPPVREEVRAVTAMQPPGPSPARKSGGGGMWLALGGVAVVAVVGAIVVFHKSDEDKNATTQVAQDTPKPTETPANVAPTPPAKEDNPPTAAANPPAPAPEPAKVVEAPGLAVAIASEPAGATVTVDGKPLDAPTPTTLTGLDVKQVYDVRVALKGFHEWKVKLKPKAGDKLDAALVPNEKLVEVSSTPAGADVVLDGKRVGRTPFTIHKLDLSKAHAIEVKRSGYLPQSRNVSATDLFEPKGDKDVLALAMTLEAQPKPDPTTRPATPVAVKQHQPSRPHPPVATKKPDEKPATPPTEKPGETGAPTEKPVVEPVAEKPAPAVEDKPAGDKAADKPAMDKPASDKASDKPTSDKPGLKSPSWMQDKPAGDKPSGDSPPPQQ